MFCPYRSPPSLSRRLIAGWVLTGKGLGSIRSATATTFSSAVLDPHYSERAEWAKAGAAGGISTNFPITAHAKPGDDLHALIDTPRSQSPARSIDHVCRPPHARSRLQAAPPNYPQFRHPPLMIEASAHVTVLDTEIGGAHHRGTGAGYFNITCSAYTLVDHVNLNNLRHVDM